VAGIASSRLQPALVIDPHTGRQIAHPTRKCDVALIGPMQEDLVVRSINRRVAVASSTSVDQGEALTVLRYVPGQQFKLHRDAIGRTRNERIATMLLYLNDAFVGGETRFPHYGLSIRAKQGDALLFFNTLANSSPDPAMRHAGDPVRTGVKWLATRWIRARPFSQWDGPESV
jgi:prolyl 4-hydroxylase